MCECEYCSVRTDETFMTTDGFYGCIVCYYINDAVDGIEDAPEPDGE